MKIVACIKRVPATDVIAQVGDDGKSLDPNGVQFMTSFYDEIAVEEAVRLKEKHGGETVVLTIGPSAASKEMRECLAKGADSGSILVDENWSGRDPLSTAKALQAKLTELAPDLVIMGRVATDRDNGAVGPMLATLLGWSCVTDVTELEIDGTSGTAKREGDAGIETYGFSLPAVITCQKDLNEPRYAGLKGIMAAKKKPLEESPCPEVAGSVEVVSLELPPARPEGRIVGEGPDAVPALIDALRNEAKVL
ncbi:MAG: electron transfer flavoprotein beta subunit [Planctomycetota bacterium]|jgi:electron transfer flavoprotein beta subunit